MWLSPMAAGIGAIIGPSLALFWLGGALVSYLVITPVGISVGWFDSLAQADVFRSNLESG